MNIRNRHRDPEIYETLWGLSFGSGTKHLFTFLSLRFSDMRRERHNFLLCWLLVHRQFTDSTNARESRRPQLVSPRRAPKINSPRLSSKLNSLVFSNSKILSPSLQGMTSFTSPVAFLIWDFYCDISDCHILPVRAREHLHSMCAPN